MWGSKLAGIAVGGAGMAWVISATNIQTAALVQALNTLSILGLVIAWLERPGERRFPWSAGPPRPIRREATSACSSR